MSQHSVIHRDTVRARAWESAICPERFNPVAALIDVATQAETPEDGRRIIKTFAEMYIDTITRVLRSETRKLREELDNA